MEGVHFLKVCSSTRGGGGGEAGSGECDAWLRRLELTYDCRIKYSEGGFQKVSFEMQTVPW